MEVTITTVSEQTMNNLSAQVPKGAWSGLPAGNDGSRAGVSSWRTDKTCPLESGHCRLEGRSTHPNQSLCCGDCQVKSHTPVYKTSAKPRFMWRKKRPPTMNVPAAQAATIPNSAKDGGR